MVDTLPQARTNSLIVKDLTDEVIVYDLDLDRAHCLNQPAAIVWRQCNGKTTVPQARKVLERELGAPVSEGVIWLALDQLQFFGLLVGEVRQPVNFSRRRVIRTLGVATLAIPAIVTISAPTAQAQASCRPRGAACTADTQCCSGNCRGNNLCA